MDRAGLPCGLLVLALAACSPDVEPIVWEGVNLDALRDAVANPTAVVDQTTIARIAVEIAKDVRAYYELSSFFSEVFRRIEGDAGPAWIIPQARAVEGTSVYVLVACPGPAGGEDPPFSHGTMRIDSPQLELSVDLELEIPGQVLVTLDQCRVGSFVYDGQARAFLDEEAGVFAYVPELTHVEDRPDAVPDGLTRPALWDLDERRISVIFEFDSGDHLVFDWLGGELKTQLRGSNGALACGLLEDGLECTTD